MMLKITKTYQGLVDTDRERRRIKKAFRNDPTTRRKLTKLMDAIESQNWKLANKLLNDKWWQGRDRKLECPRAEFIGLFDAMDVKNPKSLAVGFDPFCSYSDLVHAISIGRPITVERVK